MSDDDKLPLMTTGCLGLCLCIWIGPICILAGMACLIASISTSHWIERTDDNGDVLFHGGLFEYTRPDYNGTYISWDDYPHLSTVYVKLSIAALIISALGYLCGFFVMCYFVLCIMTESNVSWNGHSSWLSACVLNAVGIGFFARFQYQNISFVRPLWELDYGWSFHLSWGAMLIVFVGSVVTFLSAICCGGDDEERKAIDPENNQVRQGIYTSDDPENPQAMTYDRTDDTVKAF